MNFERNREPFPTNRAPAVPADAMGTPASLDVEHWTQVFNTALITTRVESTRSSGSELYSLLQTPAFNAILSSIRELASAKGASELEAAKEIISLFRRLDEVWTDLLMQEGFERLKGKN